MGQCWVPDCNHCSSRENCRFFCVPNTPLQRRRKVWKKAIGRKNSPPVKARICSCHFENGDVVNGPTIFKRNCDVVYKHLWRTPARRKNRSFSSNNHQILLSSPSENVVVLPLRSGSTPSPSRLKSPEIGFGTVMLNGFTGLFGSSEQGVWFQSTAVVESAKGSAQKRIGCSPISHWAVSPSRDTLIKEAGVQSNIRPVSSGIKTKNANQVQCRKSLFPGIKTDVADLKNKDTDIHDICSLDAFPPSMSISSLPSFTEEVKGLKDDVERLKHQLTQAQHRIADLHKKDCVQESVIQQLREELKNERDRLLLTCVSEKRLKIYTGIPNMSTFKWVLDLFPKPLTYYNKSNVPSISKENQLFMTLMKLRLNLSHALLSDWFRTSEATVTNIVRTWVSALHIVLFASLMKSIPSRAKNSKSLPECCVPFPNCRIILDCTEVRIEIPDSMRNKNLVHSGYKGYSTGKGCVGIAPNGTVTWASKLYPGSNSDKTIVRESGILELLVPGDLVLADKGFLIHDMLPPGVTLNIPPFKTTEQFTHAQVKTTTSIARARIHVERAIRRIKEYKILDVIPATMFTYATEIFQTCCALTNLKPPLLKEVEDEMRCWT